MSLVLLKWGLLALFHFRTLVMVDSIKSGKRFMKAKAKRSRQLGRNATAIPIIDNLKQ